MESESSTVSISSELLHHKNKTEIKIIIIFSSSYVLFFDSNEYFKFNYNFKKHGYLSHICEFKSEIAF